MIEHCPSSFRDPSGFLFKHENYHLRQINLYYKHDYELLMGSGLYEALTKNDQLIAHDEMAPPASPSPDHYKTIRPQQLPFISYPYEWCFSQLKDAALLTLTIQSTAIKYGMVLKDASAYNVQFVDGRPIFIDTLSFETYHEGAPWVAYRQFCQHFIAPLALMSKVDVGLSQLLRIHLDGIPLDLASRLLPNRTKLSPRMLLHIHLHAKSQKKYAARDAFKHRKGVSRNALLGFMQSLENLVRNLKWRPENTEWGDYYSDTNYEDEAFEEKKRLVTKFMEKVCPSSIWDLGGNVGVFSRIAAANRGLVVSFDIDPAAVEKNYLQCRNSKERRILPLLVDLTNPSPAIGWMNSERSSLIERGPTDLALALALLHHLAISGNVPLRNIASFLKKICKHLIIEFVPKEDSQIQRLLRTRDDIFFDYNEEYFEQSFKSYFRIMDKKSIPKSGRIVYLMKTRSD
jgi:hypothetical protein